MEQEILGINKIGGINIFLKSVKIKKENSLHI